MATPTGLPPLEVESDLQLRQEMSLVDIKASGDRIVATLSGDGPVAETLKSLSPPNSFRLRHGAPRWLAAAGLTVELHWNGRHQVTLGATAKSRLFSFLRVRHVRFETISAAMTLYQLVRWSRRRTPRD